MASPAIRNGQLIFPPAGFQPQQPQQPQNPYGLHQPTFNYGAGFGGALQQGMGAQQPAAPMRPGPRVGTFPAGSPVGSVQISSGSTTLPGIGRSRGGTIDRSAASYGLPQARQPARPAMPAQQPAAQQPFQTPYPQQQQGQLPQQPMSDFAMWAWQQLQAAQEQQRKATEAREKELRNLNQSGRMDWLKALNQGFDAQRGLVGAGVDTQLERENRLTQDAMGGALQNMTSRGLANSTVLPSVQRGIQDDSALRQREIQAAADQQRLGLENQYTQMLTGGIPMWQQQMFNMVEGITDQGPNLPMYLQFLMQPGAAQAMPPGGQPWPAQPGPAQPGQMAGQMPRQHPGQQISQTPGGGLISQMPGIRQPGIPGQPQLPRHRTWHG